MKFFIKHKKQHLKKTAPSQIEAYGIIFDNDTTQNVNRFGGFILKNGTATRHKNELSLVLKNLNFFIFHKRDFIFNQYFDIWWLLNNVVEKNKNFTHIFDMVVDLIKPPFVIKSTLLPKKIKKKTKQKYIIKIVYKNENRRIRNSYKQLQYYSNKLPDGKFNVRLYKSLLLTFLEWKSSYVFRLKTMVFKKFFKI